jgi:trimeric autotransporter adhesin
VRIRGSLLCSIATSVALLSLLASGPASATTTAAVASPPGVLFAWGEDNWGQTGLGLGGLVLNPTGGFTGTWSSISAGDHVLAIDGQGHLWSWGINPYGELGLGSHGQPIDSPQQVGTSIWRQVSGGEHDSFGIDANGHLWGWGFGGFGDSTRNEADAPVMIGGDRTWTQVSAAASPDGFDALALDSDGHMWAWGDDRSGQLGDGSLTSPVLAPEQIGTQEWSSVEAGAGRVSAAIDMTGHLWAWGWNVYGLLGDGGATGANSRKVTTPVEVGSRRWRSIDCAFTRCAAIDTNQHLWTWGANSDGLLGVAGNTSSFIRRPHEVGTAKWAEVSVGGISDPYLGSTLAVNIHGRAWVWGANNFGQLGDGTTENVALPTKIHGGPWLLMEDGSGTSFGILQSP